jgi:glycine/D-amino acid oxidase-like deaminating enzyme
MWAGHYNMNPIDGQPVIFKIGNIEVVASTSGSGITKADAIGRIASAVTLDIDEAELFDRTRIKTEIFRLNRKDIEREKIPLESYTTSSPP